MCHHVIISLASNTEPQKNLQEARKHLLQVLSDMSLTPEMQTAPVGKHRSAMYLNQLAQGTTPLSLHELNALLKEIELKMGRTAHDSAAGIVTIDLDLLLHDRQRLHEQDWERDYVKLLLGRFDPKPHEE